LKLNAETSQMAIVAPTFGALIDRYISEERMLELIKTRRGEGDPDAEESDFEALTPSTCCSYLTNLNKHIRPKWGDYRLQDVHPDLVQDWLRTLPFAPKTKAHIKATMRQLFNKAMLWRLLPIERNPMDLVEVKGITKRRRRPFILSVDQFWSMVALIPEPYHTMAIVAVCTGLRVSEILALRWNKIDFENLTMLVKHAAVNGRVKRVKTECSEDELPLDPDFATVLLNWQLCCAPSDIGWVFPSPFTGRCYHASPIQQDYIRPAGCCLVPCPKCSADTGTWCIDEDGKRVAVHSERWTAANHFGHIGWHTFRHSYRSWLDATGAPAGVQQKLMRHAQISTTMNIYGNALMEPKRAANSKVVQMALKKPAAATRQDAALRKGK